LFVFLERVALISVIILTFNSRDLVESCLHSIKKQKPDDTEVIIIDNGSTDSTVDFIKDKYPDFRLVDNKHNLGACKARNQGIEISSGEWILTLDCDVILDSDFFQSLSKELSILKGNIGMVQPKILKSDKVTIYSTGISLTYFRRYHDIGQGKPDSNDFNYTRSVFGACSAAAIYRRSMLNQIKNKKFGYFDERFFFLVEDVDLAWRAQRENWKGIYLPTLRCFHLGDSSHTDKKKRMFLNFRNRYLSICNNENIFVAIIKMPFNLIYDLPRAFIMILRYIANLNK